MLNIANVMPTDTPEEQATIQEEMGMPTLVESDEVLQDADDSQEGEVTPDDDEEVDALEGTETETGYMINTTDDDGTDLRSWPGEKLRGVGSKHRSAVMVDLGSAINVGGATTVRTMANAAERYGYTTTFTEREEPIVFGGVGAGGTRCTHEATVTLAVRANGQSAMTVPLRMNVANGDQATMPAILGTRTLRKHDSVICLRKGQECIAFPGKQGYSILWSPDTKIVPLTKTKQGHYVIEGDHYKDIPTFKSRDAAIKASGFFWTDRLRRPE